MSFDFSTLQESRAYSYMGGLGWYGDEVAQAEQELVAAHQWLIDFANVMASLRDDAISGGAPQEIVQGFIDSLETQKDLVQGHTQIMNDFYAKTGAGVAGVAGLKKYPSLRGSRLGLGWIIAATELASYLGIIARQLFWVWIVKIVGEGASAWKTQADAAQTEAVARVDCYKIWRQALDAGKTPPNCSDSGKEPTDWTTIALIAGSLFLVVMLGKK